MSAPNPVLRRLGLISGLGLFLAASVFAEAPARVPLETFFAEADCSDMQIAPDGKHVAFLTTLGLGKVGIALMDLGTGQIEPLVSASDENTKEFFWKADNWIVYGGDIEGKEAYRWRSLSIAPPKPGGKRNVLALSGRLEQFKGRSMAIMDHLRYDPDHILAFCAETDRIPMPYLMDVRTGHIARTSNYQPASQNDPGMAQADTADVADNQGVLRARVRVEGRKQFVEVCPEPPGKYVKVAEIPVDKGTWELLFFAADNETLYFYNTTSSDTRTLQSINLRTLKVSEPIFNVPDGDITSVVTSWDRTKLTSVNYFTDKPHHHFFDADQEKLQKIIDGALPDTFNSVVGRSSDEKILLIVAWSDRDPGTYYILDRTRGKMGAVAKIRQAINPALMRPMEPVSFTARDGLTIHGYLTRPAVAGGTKVPLIIHPHGGPYGIRDYWGFDPEVQYLASRGYAVLQVNYRGSGGYGQAFLRAGFHEWGGKMQDDLTDGVKWAIDQGIADPARVAIYGASYGGYATLAGLTFTPDLYCCGANYIGPSDLRLLANSPDWQSDSEKYFFGDALGNDKAYLQARSPVNFVDRIKVPLFNAYGYNDVRVDIQHWNRLESKLKEYHKNYEIMIEGNEGHGFYNEKNRIAFYQRLEAFFDKNLPAGSVRMEDTKILEMPAKPKS